MSEESPRFAGFEPLQENYCKVPHSVFAALPLFSSRAELAIVLYILRHTWGYQEFDEGKRITVDEFMNGRKRRDGTRIDNGTGLAKTAVLSGIDRAIEHGFITVEINDSDKARIKKYYMLHMKQGYDFNTSGVLLPYPYGSDSIPRSEKETIERKKEESAPPLLSDHTPILTFKNQAVYNAYQRWIGVLPPATLKQLDSACEQYSADWIIEALELTQQRFVEGKCNKPSLSYALGIVKRWSDDGYDGKNSSEDDGFADLDLWIGK